MVEAHEGRIDVAFGGALSPDVILSGPPRPILGLVLGLYDGVEPEAVGVDCQGDPAILARLGVG